MIRNESLKYLSGSGEGNVGGSKEDIRRGAIAREVMRKNRDVRIIEWKKVRRDHSIKCFISIND